jgi:hypothetical protein
LLTKGVNRNGKNEDHQARGLREFRHRFLLDQYSMLVKAKWGVGAKITLATLLVFDGRQ